MWGTKEERHQRRLTRGSWSPSNSCHLGIREVQWRAKQGGLREPDQNYRQELVTREDVPRRFIPSPKSFHQRQKYQLGQSRQLRAGFAKPPNASQPEIPGSKRLLTVPIDTHTFARGCARPSPAGRQLPLPAPRRVARLAAQRREDESPD